MNSDKKKSPFPPKNRIGSYDNLQTGSRVAFLPRIDYRELSFEEHNYRLRSWSLLVGGAKYKYSRAVSIRNPGYIRTEINNGRTGVGMNEKQTEKSLIDGFTDLVVVYRWPSYMIKLNYFFSSRYFLKGIA